MENFPGILMRTALNIDYLSSLAIFTMLSIQEHRRSFHCQVSSSVCFYVILGFHCKNYHIWDILLISFSASLLLLYIKVTEFCMLILYPATSCKCSSDLKVFWSGSTVSFKHRLMLSANRDKFNSSFQF